MALLTILRGESKPSVAFFTHPDNREVAKHSWVCGFLILRWSTPCKIVVWLTDNGALPTEWRGDHTLTGKVHSAVKRNRPLYLLHFLLWNDDGGIYYTSGTPTESHRVKNTKTLN